MAFVRYSFSHLRDKDRPGLTWLERIVDKKRKVHILGVSNKCGLNACALIGLLTWGAPTRAEDVHFESRTDFQAYEVYGPSAPAFLSRRRLVQNLGLTYADSLGKEGTTRWDLRARVRLDHEFGRSCLVAREYCLASTNSSQPDEYLFLTEDVRMDLPLASIGVLGLPGRSEARLGRQLLTLAHRMRRIDGLALSTTPISSLTLRAHAGFLPLARSLLGTETFAPVGALDDPSRSAVADRPPLWSLGAAISVRGPLGLTFDGGAEEVGEPKGAVERSLYLGLGWRDGRNAAKALLVWDPSREFVADARVQGSVALVEDQAIGVVSRAELVYHRPRFDLGTILGVLRSRSDNAGTCRR